MVYDSCVVRENRPQILLFHRERMNTLYLSDIYTFVCDISTVFGWVSEVRITVGLQNMPGCCKSSGERVDIGRAGERFYYLTVDV